MLKCCEVIYYFSLSWERRFQEILFNVISLEKSAELGGEWGMVILVMKGERGGGYEGERKGWDESGEKIFKVWELKGNS